FEPLETPAVENIETLTGKYGEEGNQLIFKILKRGEKLDVNADEKDLADLALRYDLTVPLARVVANHKNELPKFFKRYQIQPVWRADRPARGRYREFYQCDVDAIGSSSMLVEAELISAVCEILKRLNFKNFTIRINHREILTAILEVSGISKDQQTEALVALDKIDKIGREGVEKEFKERGISDEAGIKLLTAFEFFLREKAKENLSEKQKMLLLKFLNTQKNLSDEFVKEIRTLERMIQNTETSSQVLEILQRHKNAMESLNIMDDIEEFLGNHEAGNSALNNLKEIWTFGNEEFDTLKIDPSLARGLSYYTGAIFEINVPDLVGSLGGGGRYDGLIGMFGKEQIPACGFSLGLERILVVMEERGMFPKELSDSSADVLVTVWNEDSIGESLKLAGELRKQGLRVLVYPEADKLGKQFKYADSIKVPFICVLGETELAENKVTLKNLRTGEQEIVSREDIAGKSRSETLGD
ncbi:MAG: histidine--tRNA ligase, partial [Pyrinomonadaceae bacterium]|nr:histidine--tRNA ligase [Pyrinomonadaceae bacterium]